MKSLLGGLMVLAISIPACGGSAPPPAQPVSPAPAPEPVAKEEPPPPAATEGPSDEDGEAGIEGGIPRDELGAPPPPPPPSAPTLVPNAALEVQRIAGDKALVPSDEDKVAIRKAGKTQIVTTVKMCVNETGGVDSATMLKSSGYPAYDTLLQTTIEKTWKYRPFTVNGKAVAVCTAVTFIYKQTP